MIAIISVTSSQTMLTIDSSASYFLMPFRGFELAIGALLVFTKNLKLNKGLESLGAIIGLITVITSAFYLSAQSLFPGLPALLPCIGAALCIQFGTSSASEILQLRPPVKIGVISYSVYLAHWPILVFTKYYLFRDLTTLESAGLLITSILAGQALYSLIEKPFISKNRAGKFVPLASVASFTALMIIGVSTLINAKGVPSRIPDEYASFIDNPAEFHIKNFGGVGYGEEPSIGIANTPPAFLLASDSFAMQYASGMDERLKYYDLAAQGQFSLGCFLAKTHTRFENGTAKPGCQERYKSVIKYLNTNQQPLVLSMNWSGYLPYISDLSGKNIQFTTTKEYEKFISDSLLELMADAGDRKVFIVGVAPFLASPVSSSSCMLRPSYIHQACEEKLKYKLEDTFPYSTNLALKTFAETNPNLYFIDPADAICKGGICSAADNGALLFSDGAHLSIDGSKLVSKLISKTVTDTL
ncbi:acyltransferase [Pseudomonas weihenstephanensis]|uniref:Acyltransferase n=1 Tax=Pseudomonas weihenstephanensis TaxID=1608994 RepID=A0ABS1ZN31_9PSED|nr:acyltransferase family protein [Pseudomonas weihenstephanensis]MBM1197897.1 acyltransferase [Pseudomonas weihenstephanensis]